MSGPAVLSIQTNTLLYLLVKKVTVSISHTNTLCRQISSRREQCKTTIYSMPAKKRIQTVPNLFQTNQPEEVASDELTQTKLLVCSHLNTVLKTHRSS